MNNFEIKHTDKGFEIFDITGTHIVTISSNVTTVGRVLTALQVEINVNQLKEAKSALGI